MQVSKEVKEILSCSSDCVNTALICKHNKQEYRFFVSNQKTLFLYIILCIEQNGYSITIVILAYVPTLFPCVTFLSSRPSVLELGVVDLEHAGCLSSSQRQDPNPLNFSEAAASRSETVPWSFLYAPRSHCPCLTPVLAFGKGYESAF